MTYAVLQDLIDRFGEQEMLLLTDRASPPAGEIDSDVVTRALEDTDAEINAYLQRQYTLPLSNAPRLLTNLACDIARYKLHADHATDTVTERYHAACKLLRAISKGEASLGDDDAGSAVPSPSGGAPQVLESGGRTFDRDSMEGF